MKLTKILNSVFSFLQPANVFNVPGGIVAESTGALGLIGMMQNLNNYAQDMASYATSGTTAVLISATDIATNPIIQLNTGASGGYVAQLPTTAQILGALTGTVPQDGTFSKIIRIVNNTSGQTATLTAGDTPTSIIGTATIANNVCRDYVMRVLASSITFSNIGSLTL